MLIDLSVLSVGGENSVDFTFNHTFEDLSFLSNHDCIKSKEFEIKGEIKRNDKKLFIQLNYNGKIEFVCERCLKNFEMEIENSFFKEILRQLDEDIDDYILVQGNQLEVLPILEDDILINLPIQVVCKEDCIGLCPTCGVDLNMESCDCHKDNIDPRLESLKNFFTND